MKTKKILVFIYFTSIFSIFQTFSQSQIPQSEDSLATFLQTHPHDTLYIWALRPYALIQIYEKGNTKAGDSIADVTERLSQSIQYGRGIYFSYLIRAIISQQKSDYRQMLKHFKKCADVVEKYKLNLYLQEASLANIASTYYSIGEKDNCLKYTLLATQLQEKNKFRKQDATPYELIGKIKKSDGKPNEALAYFKKSLEIGLNGHEFRIAAISENNIGNTYDDLNEPKTALTHYQKGLEYAEKCKYLLLQTDLLTNIGRIYFQLKDYTTSEIYLKRNETLCKSLESKEALGSVYNDLGQLYLKQKKYKLAESYFIESKKLYYTIDTYSDIESITENLASLYAETSDFQKAYLEEKESKAALDSAFKATAKQQTQELLTKYETEAKEQQIRILGEEAKFNQVKLFAVATSSVLIILLAVVLIGWNHNRAKIKQLENAQRLRNTISADLHDEIGSTLSSISMLSEIVTFQQKNNQFNAEILQQVSKEARMVIEKMDDIIWTINPENDEGYNLETRLKTFAIPLFESKDINFSFNFSDELETLKIEMEKRRDIYLILKEAINNAVKYSQSNLITIEGKLESAQLKFSVKDNGIGFDTNVSSNRNGLKNMQVRAKKIGGTLEIQSMSGQGTKIILCIPLR
jgi:signal transduction histidine kinase